MTNHAPEAGIVIAESKILSLESALGHLQINHQKLQQSKQNLESEKEKLELENATLKAELEQAANNMAMLKQAIYGKKTEKTKINLEQLSFAFDEAEASTEMEPAQDEGASDLATEEFEEVSYTRKKPGRKPLPKELPREQVIHDLPESDLQCHCGCRLTKIGEDKSEELHSIPAQIVVKEHIRYKYACKSCEDTVKRGPAPFRPLNKSMASSSLLADMLVKKYEDHLPLYRQSRIWERKGIALSRFTLSNWVIACGEKFKVLMPLLKADILSSDYVCSDETELNVLKESKSKNYMWLHMSGSREKRAMLYSYDRARDKAAAEKFLSGYKGYHQCDGYSAYSGIHESEGVTGVGCMAHARRKFMNIVKVTKSKGVAHRVVKLMNVLYKIEKKISGHDPGQKKERREKESKPILAKLHHLLLEYKEKARPEGSLASAITYALNQWPKLTAYLKDGRIRIDNNDTERAIKPFVIGRKNWLFCNTEKGADASCIIYSLIETCKANKIHTYDYLRYILQNIQHAKTDDELRRLLPYNIEPSLLKTT